MQERMQRCTVCMYPSEPSYVRKEFEFELSRYANSLCQVIISCTDFRFMNEAIIRQIMADP
jgi:hypothetical protein